MSARRVFVIGLFSGVLMAALWWVILSTSISSTAKTIVFVVGLIGVGGAPFQYIYKTDKSFRFWRRSEALDSRHEEDQRVQAIWKFGVYCWGVMLPPLGALIIWYSQ